MAAVQYPSNPAPHMIVQGQPGAHPIQVAPHHPTTFVVQNHNRSEKYNDKSARVTGWIQLSCAIACFVFGVVQLVVGSSVGLAGTGIWSGILFFLPTGILGVFSQKKNTCVIVAYMVMSIISSIIGFIVLAMGMTAAAVSANNRCSFFGIWDCGYGVMRARIVFDSFLAITGFLELVVAIVAACYCCGGVCCGRNDSSTANTMVYHYQNNVTPGPMAMMVPTYGQPVGGQPMGYVSQQPPPTNQPQGPYPVAYPQAGTAPAPQPNYNMGAHAPPQYSEVQLTQPEKM